MTAIDSSKDSLRRYIRDKRASIPATGLEAADKALERLFKARLESDEEFNRIYYGAENIAVYKAVRGELPCDSLAGFFRSQRRKTLYPRMAGADLEFFAVDDPERELETSRFGLLEPLSSICKEDPLNIDIVILPGLAFSPDGRRLGQGGGFYDRWLSSFPDTERPYLIGICMKFQLFEDIPVAPFDIRADVVLCV